MSGDINQSLPQLRPLTEVLKAAEGRVDYDTALVDSLSSQPVPGDATIEPSATPVLLPSFGVPTAHDPDPFGVLALGMAGVDIREAGSHLRPESSQFEFHPSPTSPVFPKVKRGSVDTAMSRSNRGSYMSNRTEKSQTTDACTQTFSATPETTPTHSQSQSEDGHHQNSPNEVQRTKEPVEIDYTKIDISSLRMLSNFPDLEEAVTEPSQSNGDAATRSDINDKDEKNEQNESKEEEGSSHSPISTTDSGNSNDADDEEDENSSDYNQDDDTIESEGESDYDDELDELDEDEAVVFEVATAQAPTLVAMVGTQVVQAKGAVVNIPKRVPPPLPLRSPARTSRRRSQMPDIGNIVSSPLRKEFDSVETSGGATPRASKIPESTTDEAEATPVPNAAIVKMLENLTDSETALAPEFQERSAKRASHLVQTPLTEEQADVGAGDKPTASVA